MSERETEVEAEARPSAPPPLDTSAFALGVILAKVASGDPRQALEALRDMRRMRDARAAAAAAAAGGAAPSLDAAAAEPAPTPIAARGAHGALTPERAAAIDLWCDEQRPHALAGHEADRAGQTSADATYGGTPAALLGDLLGRIGAGPDDVFYDLGAGIGQATLAASEVCGDATGFEYLPGLVRVAREGAKALGCPNARFLEADLLAGAAAPGATILFAYATCYTPPLVAAVRDLARALPSGGRVLVVSHALALDDGTPDPAFELLFRDEREWARSPFGRVLRLPVFAYRRL